MSARTVELQLDQHLFIVLLRPANADKISNDYNVVSIEHHIEGRSQGTYPVAELTRHLPLFLLKRIYEELTHI